jgi:hypothetical protein
LSEAHAPRIITALSIAHDPHEAAQTRSAALLRLLRGYASLVRHTTGLRLLTRNGHDWADHYPLIAEAAGALQVRSFLLDGRGGLPRGWHAGVRSAALLPRRKR